MKKYLFICKGNIGRSQMAEAFYNRLSKSNNSWSAGTDDCSGQFKNPSQKILDIMSEEEIDVSKYIVKQVNESMVDESKKVIVMQFKKECPKYLLNSNKVVFWDDVKDPKGLTYEESRGIRDLIKDKVCTMLNH